MHHHNMEHNRHIPRNFVQGLNQINFLQFCHYSQTVEFIVQTMVLVLNNAVLSVKAYVTPPSKFHFASGVFKPLVLLSELDAPRST